MLVCERALGQNVMLDMSVSIFMCESIRLTCHADGSMLIVNFKVENFASSCSK